MPSSTSSSRGIAASRLSIAIAAFVLLSLTAGGLKYFAISRLDPGLMPVTDAFWHEKTNAPSIYDIVVAGDSRVFRGISPGAMREVLTGRKILNFGYDGGGLSPEMIRLATAKLAPNGGRILVVGVTAYALTEDAFRSDSYHEIANADPQVIPVSLQQALPRGLQLMFSPEATMRAFTGTFEPGGTGEPLLIVTAPDHGWLGARLSPPNRTAAFRTYRHRFISGKRVSDHVVEAFLGAVRAEVARGVTVYGLRPPATPEMHTLEETEGRFDVESVKRQFSAAGGRWLEVAPPEEFESYDGSHLEAESARRMSIQLARAIARDERS